MVKSTSSVDDRREAPTSRFTTLQADVWKPLPNLPTQRNHFAADAIDGKIYVAGGRFDGGFGSENRYRRSLRPEDQPLVARRSMSRPRGGVNGIAAEGCLYVFGGEGNPDNPYGIYADHDYYNPVTDSCIAWKPCRSPCTA